MIAWLLLLLLALALGVGAAVLFGTEAGYVFVHWQGWTLETTLAAAIFALLGTALLVWLLLRGLGGAWALPGRVRAYWAERRETRAHRSVFEGLRQLFADDPASAERLLIKRVADHEAPDVSHLAAARAAQAQGAYDRRDHYLELAQRERPGPAVFAEQVRLLLASGETSRALQRARAFAEAHPALASAQRALVEALAAEAQWGELARVLAERAGALPAPERSRWQLRALVAQIESAVAQGRLETVKALWAAAPGALCAQPEVQRAYARGLARLGAETEAVPVISQALKTRWDPELARCFGALEGLDPVAQLASLEAWISQHGEEPELLHAAGRTCLRAQLWGKARSYLEAALKGADTPAVLQALAELAERTQQPEEALRCYREGLRVALSGRGAVT